MVSTFHSIELGKKSLMNHQVAVNVTGSNISNVNNATYSRNRVHISSDHSLYPSGISSPNIPGQIGMGSKIQQIERIRDMFLEVRILNESSGTNYWSKLKSLYKTIESLYKEPNHVNLRTSFQAFIKSWDQVGQYPEEMAYRETLKFRSVELSNSIQRLYKQLSDVRYRVDDEIQMLIPKINAKIKQVADLNTQIRMLKAENQNPNHLLDQRDALINELSKYVDLEVSYEDHDDQVMLFVGSQILVQGDQFESIRLSGDNSNQGLKNLVWLRYGNEVHVKKGHLKALLEVRDEVLPQHIKHLDTFALNLMETVNSIHEESFSLKGQKANPFFKKQYIHENFKEVFSLNSSLEDSNYLAYYRIQGNRELNENDLLVTSGLLKFKDLKGNFIEVPYFETDRLKDLIDRINNTEAQAFAYLDLKGRLAFKASADSKKLENDFFIQYIEDSGQFLSSFAGVFKLKEESVYDFSNLASKDRLTESQKAYISPRRHPSSWISIDEKILMDVRNIAVSRADEGNPEMMAGKGDGRNAYRILAALDHSEEYQARGIKEISHRAFYVDKNESSFQSFLDTHVARFASLTEQSILEYDKSEIVQRHLTDMRKSVSGVSMDEEMSNLLMYQKSYQASAKFISYVDQLLETLIFRLGA